MGFSNMEFINNLDKNYFGEIVGVETSQGRRKRKLKGEVLEPECGDNFFASFGLFGFSV